MKKAVQEQINKICLTEWEKAMDALKDCHGYDHYKQLRNCNATVITTPYYHYLRSYNTVVAVIDRETDTLIDMLRYVYGYTATSAQHISKFNQDYCARHWGCDVVRRYYPI